MVHLLESNFTTYSLLRKLATIVQPVVIMLQQSDISRLSNSHIPSVAVTTNSSHVISVIVRVLSLGVIVAQLDTHTSVLSTFPPSLDLIVTLLFASHLAYKVSFAPTTYFPFTNVTGCIN
jgi:hypothetical protein